MDPADGDDATLRHPRVPDHLPAVVATDLDGTLLHSDGTVSARTIDVLSRIVELGVRVVFVTGRPPETVTEVADQVGHTGYAVCSNGAVVLDLASMTPVAEHLLDPDTAAALAERIRAAVPGTSFGVQLVDRFRCEPAYPYDPWYPFPPEVVEDLPALFDRPAAKLVVRHPGQSGDRLLELSRRAADEAGLTERVELTISTSIGFVEVAAAGVSKAGSLAELCAGWDIPAERVVAFGDMPNDISTLTWAGRSYVVAGGHRDAVAAADEVAPSAGADGVAVVLDRIYAELLAPR